ncbi:MAG: phospholipase D-like domain-containing protein, partial [Candidatus Spyradenecus sp.]
TPFVRLLEEAAEDPEVTAIRITLYRLAANSRIAQALARAAEHGKDVLCLLELRARFDEESNINYAEMLQEAGCTVLYGLPHCKVHAKVCLILYRPDSRDGSPRAITQIGTGNYNEKTAALYTDLSYLTADPDIAADAAGLFRALCRGESAHNPRRLWVAPESFLSRLLAELDTEIAEARAGRPAAVFIKANGLNSLPVIAKLIECSQAGVPVELYIRGICCLRPGIPGLTDRISVRSIVGDHLEHSRILAFGPPGHERLFIGSGDLLNRNLTRRVEVYTPILDAPSRREVLELIELLRADTAKARQMSPDGTYALPPAPSPRRSSQACLRERFAQRNALPPAPPKAPTSLLRRLLHLLRR